MGGAQVVDSLLESVAPEVWVAFHEAFDARVAALAHEDHWYYDKRSSNIGDTK